MFGWLGLMLNSRHFCLDFWCLMNWLTLGTMATVMNSICVLMLIMFNLGNLSFLIMSIRVIITNGGLLRLGLFRGRRRSGGSRPVAVRFVLDVACVIVDYLMADVGLGSAIVSVVLHLLTIVG